MRLQAAQLPGLPFTCEECVNDGQHAQAETGIQRAVPRVCGLQVPPNPGSLWFCDLGVQEGQDQHPDLLIRRLQPQAHEAWGSGPEDLTAHL